MNKIEDLFKGFDKNKVSEAMKKAEIMSKNEDIRKAFNSVDKNDLMNLFSKLDSKNKDAVLNEILRSDNAGITELLKRIKNR